MLPEPGLVTFGSVADAIGAFRYHDATAMEAVASALHGRRALLVLDNVEQVVGGAGRFVVGLLARCRELAILATNREALHVSSEVVVVVPPLDVERDAPLLFRRQASTASPGIDLDAEHDNVLAICRELDGLPLALELAAARVATMSISDVQSAWIAGSDCYAVSGAKGDTPRSREPFGGRMTSSSPTNAGCSIVFWSSEEGSMSRAPRHCWELFASHTLRSPTSSAC
jgi:hypothetical protein